MPGLPRRYPPAQEYTAQCDACHRDTGWQVSIHNINEHQDRFPLIGAHAMVGLLFVPQGGDGGSVQPAGIVDGVLELSHGRFQEGEESESHCAGIFDAVSGVPQLDGQLDDDDFSDDDEEEGWEGILGAASRARSLRRKARGKAAEFAEKGVRTTEDTEGHRGICLDCRGAC